MSVLGPRRGLHCGTHEYLRVTLPVSCSVHTPVIAVIVTYMLAVMFHHVVVVIIHITVVVCICITYYYHVNRNCFIFYLVELNGSTDCTTKQC